MLEEYTYQEQQDGRVDTLVKAIDRIELLEKQLKITLDALKEIYLWGDDEFFNAVNIAEKTFAKIKEIRNDNIHGNDE